MVCTASGSVIGIARSVSVNPSVSASFAGMTLAQRPVLKQNVLQYTTADSGTVAITGVTVIDGRGGAAKKGQTVVIANGMIADVGANVKAPAGARMIDGNGMTLIPGMVGMHDHMFYTAAGGFANQMSFTAPRLYLASGVTNGSGAWSGACELYPTCVPVAFNDGPSTISPSGLTHIGAPPATGTTPSRFTVWCVSPKTMRPSFVQPTRSGCASGVSASRRGAPPSTGTMAMRDRRRHVGGSLLWSKSSHREIRPRAMRYDRLWRRRPKHYTAAITS